MKLHLTLVILSCLGMTFLAQSQGSLPQGQTEWERITAKMLRLKTKTAFVSLQIKLGLASKEFKLKGYEVKGYKEQEWEYDREGRLVSFSLFDAKSGTETQRYRYTYDPSGKVIGETTWAKGFSGSKWKYAYIFEGGKIAKQTCYETDGRFRAQTSYKYDTKGNLVEEVSADEGGKIGGTTRYTYDAMNRVIARAGTLSDFPETSDTFELGADGRILKATGFDEQGNQSDVTVNTFDRNGLLLMSVTDSRSLAYTSTERFIYTYFK